MMLALLLGGCASSSTWLGSRTASPNLTDDPLVSSLPTPLEAMEDTALPDEPSLSGEPEDNGIVDLLVQEDSWPRPDDWQDITMSPEQPTLLGRVDDQVSLRFSRVAAPSTPVPPAANEPAVDQQVREAGHDPVTTSLQSPDPTPLADTPDPVDAAATDNRTPDHTDLISLMTPTTVPTAPAEPITASADPLSDVLYDVPVEVNEAVRVYLEYFQTRLRPTFARYLIRAGAYIPEMKAILRQHGVPEDMVYLAMIESGFNPYAFSRASASGPWQFIASTGKRYGLRQDYWVDERRDVTRSTHAAATYLTDLYARFGDWYLAMASYNVGEGRVANALKRVGGKTFWDLRNAYALPQETRDYVPKFLAAAIIGKSPESFGFFVETHPPRETTEVTVTGPTALTAIARAVNVPVEEIKFLNAQLRRGLTPPDHKPYQVRIPKGSELLFAANFPAIQAAEQELWAKKASNMGSGFLVRHKVRSGESLSTIAKRYGTRVSRIQRANKMGKKTMIRVGKVILVPSGRSYASNTNSTKRITHKVRRGDSLWKIANRYKVRIKDLMVWNRLTSKSVLRPGDRIVIVSRGS